MAEHADLYHEIAEKAQREGRRDWPSQDQWDILTRMRDTNALTEVAYASLAWGMANFHDMYAYYSADGRPYVWAGDTRWTAAEWNAECEQPRLTSQ